ncbi:hypothetical protein AMJ52_05630 [candidate division TA06 bacterium DG_78]|uniref:Uncharacterized protein n=1 Tax=candidate division TA06 bacterium DG_78 TaxID=1703772 RepID=A0A0S7YDW5_UNCT6|nr:MAG: hypothetical protein AMJ52_05630 [candidate division TA06 bacterium DG_78]
MKRIYFTALISLVLCICLYAEVDIYGYFEPQYTGIYTDENYYQFQSNKLRVDLKSTIVNNVEFGADVIYLLYFGATNWNILDFLPDQITSPIPLDQRALFQITYGDSFYLDNVYARLANYRFALTVGKQQISLGTGYFSNPTDVFNTKDALDPTYEQPGHNAIRLDAYLADRFGIMLMYTPVEWDWQNSGKLVRLKTGLGHFDISVLGYEFQHTTTDFYTFIQTQQRRRLLGADFVGEILGFGVWGEGCYNFMDDDDDNFFEFLIGTDYTFEGGLYTMFEYHHNSSGESDYPEYDLNDWMQFFTGETKTISQDQVYGLIQYPLTDFIMVGTSAIFSISDQSIALVPMVYYSIFENVELTLMFNLYIGEEGKVFSSSLGNGGLMRAQIYF